MNSWYRKYRYCTFLNARSSFHCLALSVENVDAIPAIYFQRGCNRALLQKIISISTWLSPKYLLVSWSTDRTQWQPPPGTLALSSRLDCRAVFFRGRPNGIARFRRVGNKRIRAARKSALRHAPRRSVAQLHASRRRRSHGVRPIQAAAQPVETQETLSRLKAEDPLLLPMGRRIIPVTDRFRLRFTEMEAQTDLGRFFESSPRISLAAIHLFISNTD